MVYVWEYIPLYLPVLGNWRNDCWETLYSFIVFDGEYVEKVLHVSDFQNH